MDASEVRLGLRVKTVEELGTTKGMLINIRHLEARESNKFGVVGGYVPGHGGDVWWVRHEDDTVGAYAVGEFNPFYSWEHVFNGNLASSWGHASAALGAANQAGYPMISWNGRVYEIREDGTIENLNESLCLVEDLE